MCTLVLIYLPFTRLMVGFNWIVGSHILYLLCENFMEFAKYEK
jgi:hypothetical protein